MSEEYKEEILDSPLVVHKESDASYQETASEVSMSSTHLDEDGDDYPTLERHRFRKKKKSKKPLVISVIVIAIIAGIICALYYSNDVISAKKERETTSKKTYTTQAENKFEGIITVKGTYIFFEGEEIDGLNELERKIKYIDKDSKFIIQDENADFNLLTLDKGDKPGGSILSLLSKYGIDYDVTHIVSSGLESKYETTATESSTTKKKSKSKTKKKTSSKKTSSKKTSKSSDNAN